MELVDKAISAAVMMAAELLVQLQEFRRQLLEAVGQVLCPYTGGVRCICTCHATTLRVAASGNPWAAACGSRAGALPRAWPGVVSLHLSDTSREDSLRIPGGGSLSAAPEAKGNHFRGSGAAAQRSGVPGVLLSFPTWEYVASGLVLGAPKAFHGVPVGQSVFEGHHFVLSADNPHDGAQRQGVAVRGSASGQSIEVLHKSFPYDLQRSPLDGRRLRDGSHHEHGLRHVQVAGKNGPDARGDDAVLLCVRGAVRVQQQGHGILWSEIRGVVVPHSRHAGGGGVFSPEPHAGCAVSQEYVLHVPLAERSDPV